MIANCISPGGGSHRRRRGETTMGVRTKIGVGVALAALALWAALVVPRDLRAQVVAPVVGPSPTPTIAPTPTPRATPQAFSCSCSSPGQQVVWSGRLSASNYF